VKRDEFDHVLRAAAHALGQRDFLVIGTAALLGSYPEESLPERATRSREADLAPFDDPDGDKSMLLEGALDLGSQFEKTFTYYADGVDFRSGVAPYGWRNRLVKYRSPASEPGVGWCLEPYDLAATKICVGRAKDFEFVGALLDAGVIGKSNLMARISLMPKDRITPAQIDRAIRWLDGRQPR